MKTIELRFSCHRGDSYIQYYINNENYTYTAQNVLNLNNIKYSISPILESLKLKHYPVHGVFSNPILDYKIERKKYKTGNKLHKAFAKR
jgi:hypothetical protein